MGETEPLAELGQVKRLAPILVRRYLVGPDIRKILNAEFQDNPLKANLRNLSWPRLCHKTGAWCDIFSEFRPYRFTSFPNGSYGTMGTPEIAIIDKKGIIRFQEFGGFRPERAQALIRSLLQE